MRTNVFFRSLCFSLLALFLLFPRVLNLDAFHSPDEDRWTANSAGFISSLAAGHWGDLMKLPHPGITTQWLGALSIRHDDWAMKKLPIVAGQALLILLAGYVFGRLWGFGGGFLTAIFLGVDPFIYAHTRVYGMDSLLALFTILCLGLLLLWNKNKEYRYLIFSGFCGAAAVLSKISGIIIIPFILIAMVMLDDNRRLNKTYFIALLRKYSFWFFAFFISALIILPSLAINPQNILGDILEFFRSDEYGRYHVENYTYYWRSLVFFTNPIQWIALFSCVGILWVVLWKKIQIRFNVKHVAILMFFVLLFVLQMSTGKEKADRYILSVFAIFDVVAAASMIALVDLFRKYEKSLLPGILLALILSATAWQENIIISLQPHGLSYVNPFTKHFFGGHRLGWGEGLDLAADYLNQKPNAKNLKVASYYPNEFGKKFVGSTDPADRFGEDGIDYVVLYRAMLERSGSWENDAFNYFIYKKPEKIIYLDGIKYVWIYKK